MLIGRLRPYTPRLGGYVCASGFVGTPALKCQVARFECQTNSERVHVTNVRLIDVT